MARIRSLALATALTLLLPASAQAAPGDFDPSFYGDGIATYDWGGGFDSVHEVLVQPDSRIVLAGAGVADPYDLVAARLSPDGTPDPSFSFDGVAPFSLGGNDWAEAAARQPDGKIVAAGFTEVGAVAKGVVVRLNADGTLDGSFSGDGIATLDYGGTVDFITDLLVQPDGKIVTSGTGGPARDGVVTRLNPDGLPDSTFDGDGTATFDFGGTDYAETVTLQPDGKPVVLGYSPLQGMWVARLNANGSPDASFDGDGVRPLEPFTGDYAYDVLVQPDRKIVLLGGGEGSGFLVTRLTPDGSFDESFANSEGIAVVNFGSSDEDTPYAAVLQANGKIVVAGSTATGASTLLAVARLQPGGSLDTTFSSDGRQTLSGTNSWAYSAALQPDGRIVVAGDNGSDALVVRLEGDPVPAGAGPPSGGPGGGGPGGPGIAGVPRCAGKKATIVGTNRSDRLKGTRRGDVIVALGGNDKIAAGRGNDLICAGDGNDAIDGGLGNDRLFGQSGNDKLGGASGKDALSGGGGKDRLSGGGGKDSCAGGSGKDRAACERGRA